MDQTQACLLSGAGALLLDAGKSEEAKFMFTAALFWDPQEPTALANLGYMALTGGHVDSARGYYEAALRRDPNMALAHHGLATIFERNGDTHSANRHRQAGMAARPLTITRYAGTGEPVRVLLLGSKDSNNVSVERHMDDRVFLSMSLVVEYFDPRAALPPHDLVFNTVADADAASEALHLAAHFIAKSNAPVINAPAKILATGREDNARRLSAIPGVRTPRIRTFKRIELDAADAMDVLAAAGFTPPFLLRAPGYHTGLHFERVATAVDLELVLASLPGDEVLAIEYLDAYGPDGRARKYRMMAIGGALYPLHLAIAPQWKVHYFSADMSENAENRAQDAAYLADPAAVLGPCVMETLARIAATPRSRVCRDGLRPRRGRQRAAL